jgi:hypothetical protein
MRTFSVFVAFIALGTVPCFSEANPDLQAFFEDYIGLAKNQIASIRAGQPITKVLPSRSTAEIVVFGAIHINAAPDSFLKLSRDLDRLRRVHGYLAIGRFSNPPQLSDLRGFTFDAEEIKELKSCQPGNCRVQMPVTSIEELQRAVEWSAPNAEDRVNQLLQRTTLNFLLAYQCKGNSILGTYNDKRNPTKVAREFKYLLSYSKPLVGYMPDFYKYLLIYPNGRPKNIEEMFYWEKVKFGLQPTLRVLQVVTARGTGRPPNLAYAIATKQLYSSHYFQAALHLTFCIRDEVTPKRPAFYLVTLIGSEQAGLTGLKGSVIRRIAVTRAASSLERSLMVIKRALEHGQ